MRSAPNNYETLLKIQNEINEVARRESELRELHQNAGLRQNSLNGDSTTKTSREEPKLLQRAVSTSSLSSNSSNGFGTTNGNAPRRFIPNSKGVMQKFFKLRGKVNAVSAINNTGPISAPKTAWKDEVVVSPPVKALIPSDKPLRKGFVPVEARILTELREMENREQELKTERRRSQPNLMASLENSDEELIESRTPSPAIFNKLKPARSLSQLLDEEYSNDNSPPTSLKPARSLAQLCDVSDEEIVSSKSLIKQWESRIKESQREA